MIATTTTTTTSSKCWMMVVVDGSGRGGPIHRSDEWEVVLEAPELRWREDVHFSVGREVRGRLREIVEFESRAKVGRGARTWRHDVPTRFATFLLGEENFPSFFFFNEVEEAASEGSIKGEVSSNS